MFNELKNERIILDFEKLIKNAENFNEDTSMFTEFYIQRILSLSCNN